MHRARIAAGTDNLRSGKGGPRNKARLSFSLLLASAIAFPVAAGDLLEETLGTRYQQQLLLSPAPPAYSVGALPGFAEPSAETAPFPGTAGNPGNLADTGFSDPRFALRLGSWQRDLIRKQGKFSFADKRDRNSLDLGARIPSLRIRFGLDRTETDLSMGDTAASLDAAAPKNAHAGKEEWAWRSAASIEVTPLLVPSLIVSGISSSPDADVMEAMALQGRLPAGWEWSMALGRKRIDFPLRLKLSGYSPIALPFQLRQNFLEAGLGYRHGPWEAAWSGHYQESGLPKALPQGYSLNDSGYAWRQNLLAAYDRLRSGSGYRVSLSLDAGLGEHVFQGMTRKGEKRYPFSWQNALQKDYSTRLDFRLNRGRFAYGGWLGGGESEYDALRPDVAFNRHFWDRNGVIDSYQGSLLGVFSDETWLLNGAVYAAQGATGLWAERAFYKWNCRAAVGYQYLLLQANTHLTRRQTTFLFGFKDETFDTAYPTVEADLIPVQLRLSRDWGDFFCDADASAELPARVRIHRSETAGVKRPPVASEYSGGMISGIRIGYRLR